MLIGSTFIVKHQPNERVMDLLVTDIPEELLRDLQFLLFTDDVSAVVFGKAFLGISVHTEDVLARVCQLFGVVPGDRRP